MSLLIMFYVCSSNAVPVSDVQAYFSPEDHCDQKVIAVIDSAQNTLNIAIFSFTKKEIAQAVMNAKKRGVNVLIIMDKGQAAGDYSKDEILQTVGIPVLLDKHPGYMHNKFVVADDRRIITGSFNWSESATYKNDENLLIIDSLELAASYNAEFEELLKENQ